MKWNYKRRCTNCHHYSDQYVNYVYNIKLNKLHIIKMSEYRFETCKFFRMASDVKVSSESLHSLLKHLLKFSLLLQNFELKILHFFLLHFYLEHKVYFKTFLFNDA